MQLTPRIVLTVGELGDRSRQKDVLAFGEPAGTQRNQTKKSSFQQDQAHLLPVLQTAAEALPARGSSMRAGAVVSPTSSSLA